MRAEDFERLYAEHAQALLGFLVYRTGDRALAEDMLADTFEKVLTTRRGFDRRRASEKTWLYTIALNRLRDHARRAGAESRAIERAAVEVSAGEGVKALDLAESRQSLSVALATLSTEEREAVALRYGADLSVPEVARVLGESVTTMEGRVYRALGKLRETLG